MFSDHHEISFALFCLEEPGMDSANLMCELVNASIEVRGLEGSGTDGVYAVSSRMTLFLFF